MAKADTELLKEILAELKKIRWQICRENKEVDEDDDNNGDDVEIDKEPDKDDKKDQGETDND
jgi:hypothetical protein